MLTDSNAWRGFYRYMAPDRGFRGWLVWFFASTVVSALGQAVLLLQSGGSLFVVSRSTLSHPAATFALIGVDVSMQVVHLVATLTGLWLFATEDRRTPAFWTAYFTAVVPFHLISAAVTGGIASLVYGATLLAAVQRALGYRYGVIAFAVVWALYWRRSRRVRNTYGYVGWRWPPPTDELEYWPFR